MIFNNAYIIQNNKRILSSISVQSRYVPKEKCFCNQNRIQTKKSMLNNKQKEWLMAVYHYQYKNTLTEINNLIGLPNSSGSRINKECIKNNLLKTIEINFGKGRPKKYPVLLPCAYTSLGVDEKKFFGKGAGEEHVLFQHLLAEKFKEYKATIELYRGQKHIDVAVETNVFLLAIEVEMTSVHVVENIKKDIENAKADFVIASCRDKKVLNEIQIKLIELPAELRVKTEVILLSKLLNSDPKDIVNSIDKNSNTLTT